MSRTRSVRPRGAVAIAHTLGPGVGDSRLYDASPLTEFPDVDTGVAISMAAAVVTTTGAAVTSVTATSRVLEVPFDPPRRGLARSMPGATAATALGPSPCCAPFSRTSHGQASIVAAVDT